MYGGGRDRAELLPYSPEAYRESDDPNRLMGCHSGNYAGLNIQNAQEGMVYAWANSDPRSVMSARMKGYHVVQADDPERAGYNQLLEGGASGSPAHSDIDSSSTGFPGVVLVRRSAQDERRVRAEEQTLREQLLRGGNAESNFQAQASSQEIAAGGSRFARADHRTHVTAGPSEGGQVLDAWNPSRGLT